MNDNEDCFHKMGEGFEISGITRRYDGIYCTLQEIYKLDVSSSHMDIKVDGQLNLAMNQDFS